MLPVISLAWETSGKLLWQIKQGLGGVVKSIWDASGLPLVHLTCLPVVELGGTKWAPRGRDRQGLTGKR